jgi:type III pantothenate kinase
MKADIVADIGNSRIKCGRCTIDRVREVAVLSDNPANWQEQCDRWQVNPGIRWVIAGVQPAKRDQLVEWVRARGDRVLVLHASRQLPLDIALDHPDRVGIDRLLNAIAAKRRRANRRRAIIVDAGSAVTVDVVNEAGAFTGGAVFPGIRLMAKALNDHTALLPLVSVDSDIPDLPAVTTADAMKAGIFFAVVGGIRALIGELESGQITADIFLTGGDSGLVAPALPTQIVLWPEMTLEGIRISAELLPDE